MRHKIIMVVSVIIGSAVWACANDVLRASDASSGLSLVSASAPPVTVAIMTVLWGLPAMGLGLLATVSRKAISGLLVTAVSLCLLAIVGGEQAGWMYRSNLPDEYGRLMVEMLVWQIGMVVLLLIYQQYADLLRQKLPKLIDTQQHHSLDIHVLQWDKRTILAGLVCAVVAWVVGGLLMRTSATGQIIGALIVAFGFGGFMAQLIFPNSNPIGVMFSPMLVAVVAYALVLYRFNDQGQVLDAWYRMGGTFSALPPRLPPLAQALPIHFISAGIVGCCLGAGIGHASNVEHGLSSNFATSVMRTLKGADDKSD
jgi:hypothetical protein